MSLRARLIYDRRLRLIVAFLILIAFFVLLWITVAIINRNADTRINGDYYVIDVIDGDTIVVRQGSREEKVRLIGLDTPETVDSRVDTQCYGPEASQYLKERLTNKTVELINDETQGNLDKYNRLLRYVVLNGEDIGLDLIKKGYAKEYTYDSDYERKESYKKAEAAAKAESLGLWGEQCSGTKEEQSQSEPQPAPTGDADAQALDRSNCVIKGNISYYTGEKIYHVPGQKYYEPTKIEESEGERWFCSEAEAQAAGWRKSKE